MTGIRMFGALVIGITLACFVLVLMLLRSAKSADLAARDPKYARGQMLLLAVVYVTGMVCGVVEVMRGELPLLSLLGLVVPALLVWWLLRARGRIKVPPQ